jgi:hypothetical protein
MPFPFSLPENCKIVKLYGGATNGISSGTDFISCKNALKVWFVGYTWGTNAATFPITLLEATDVAAGTQAAVTATFPIWKVIATTSTDALTRITDAYTLTIDPDGTDSTMLWAMEWDPAKHTAGYDCVAAKGTTGNASDYCVILAIIQERYQQALAPSAIVD